MDTPAQFTQSSDEDLLRLWRNRQELTSAEIEALQSEFEKRQLARVVYTTAGLPRLELLRTTPVSYERKIPVQRTMRHGIARLLFVASGFLLAVFLRLSVPLLKNPDNIVPLITHLAVIVLIPLVVFFILSKVWKQYASLVTSVVAFVLTAVWFWYVASGYYGGTQLHKGIEKSSVSFLSLRNKLVEDLDKCKVQEIIDILVSPEKLTQKNLEDAQSRITTALALLKDYRDQYEEWVQGVQKAIQPMAEKTQARDWRELKDTLLLESQRLEAQKEYFQQISEFVRYMRYYQHLYRVDHRKITFHEADGSRTYDYYKSTIQEYLERQKKLDAALSSRVQQLTSILQISSRRD
jgi:hypothetical protein